MGSDLPVSKMSTMVAKKATRVSWSFRKSRKGGKRIGEGAMAKEMMNVWERNRDIWAKELWSFFSLTTTSLIFGADQIFENEGDGYISESGGDIARPARRVYF